MADYFKLFLLGHAWTMPLPFGNPSCSRNLEVRKI